MATPEEKAVESLRSGSRPIYSKIAEQAFCIAERIAGDDDHSGGSRGFQGISCVRYSKKMGKEARNLLHEVQTQLLPESIPEVGKFETPENLQLGKKGKKTAPP